MEQEFYTFGPHKIHCNDVFYTTPLSLAMVNFRPVLPDVLVIPRREVQRFLDLTTDETVDLWLTAKHVATHLERYHGATSTTFNMMDGPAAGQTVLHVHIHVVPRKLGDFKKKDDIYDAINESEVAMAEKVDVDKDGKERTSEERAKEADAYRALFLKI